MHDAIMVNFYGIHGIENIKAIKKYELAMKTWNMTTSVNGFERVKDVLDAVHNINSDPFIFTVHGFTEVSHFDDYVNWFIENKCNWEGKQYRLNKYYWLGVYGPTDTVYFCIVLLKEVIYTDRDFSMVSFNCNIPVSGPITGDGWKEIDQESEEFKDAVIVVKRE